MHNLLHWCEFYYEFKYVITKPLNLRAYLYLVNCKENEEDFHLNINMMMW